MVDIETINHRLGKLIELYQFVYEEQGELTDAQVAFLDHKDYS